MASQETVNIGAGPDSGSADNLYQGFLKLNNNMTLLAGSGTDAVTSGASAIGYYGGTTVQAAIDSISNGATSASNVPTTSATYPNADSSSTSGWISDDIVTNDVRFRKIVGGNNVTVTTDETEDVVIINSGLANSFTVRELDYTNNDGDTILDTDEIIIIDTEDTDFDLVLQAGTDQRILYIKNQAWTGTAGAHTQTTADVTITAATSPAQEYIEDDRTAQPATSTQIGPGSTMKIVFSTTLNCWSII